MWHFLQDGGLQVWVNSAFTQCIIVLSSFYVKIIDINHTQIKPNREQTDQRLSVSFCRLTEGVILCEQKY